MLSINEITEEQFKRLLDEYFAQPEKRLIKRLAKTY